MIGGKSVPEWSFVHPKKHVFDWNFLMKPSPYLFSGPDWLYGTFGGENCSGRKLCSILPQKPSRIRFYKKHYFGMNFCTKSHLTYFPGQLDLMARLGAKVSRSEVSSTLKTKFSVGIFWWKLPHTSFLGLIGYMVHSGAKLFRTKNLLSFPSKALSNSFFPKNTFSVWIFFLNRTSPIFLAKRTRWHDWGQKCPGVKFRPS